VFKMERRMAIGMKIERGGIGIGIGREKEAEK
jgi:hypothetical protein